MHNILLFKGCVRFIMFGEKSHFVEFVYTVLGVVIPIIVCCNLQGVHNSYITDFDGFRIRLAKNVLFFFTSRTNLTNFHFALIDAFDLKER